MTKRACLLLIMTAGCGASRPQLDHLDPELVSNLAPTPVQLHGDYFLDAASYSVDDTRRVVLDDHFVVLIDSDELPGSVTRLSDQILDATIPAGLAVGVYDVTVHGPTGSATKLAALRVGGPAVLTAVAALPPTVQLGQTFDLVVTVRNDGEAPALAVVPAPPTASGTGSAALLSGPAAADLAVGASQDFHFSYSADVAGALTLTTRATGHDASLVPLSAAPASASTQIGLPPSALTGTTSVSPATVVVGQTFAVNLNVTNNTSPAASQVMPATPVLSGTGAAVLLTSPSSATIPGGNTATFTWTYRASAVGTLSFALAATGSIQGSAASTPTVNAGPVTINRC